MIPNSCFCFMPARAGFTVLGTALLVAALSACGHDDEGLPAPFTARVSSGPAGSDAVGGISGTPAVSTDGRFIAFASSATNLVANDTNNAADVFVADTATGQITRISQSSAGAQADGGSSRYPALSGDGRYVVFESDATNLVANDTNGVTDIFLHDRVTGDTSRVSVTNTGAQATGLASYQPAISADGQQIAFVSGAANLVLGDSNGLDDIFVRDRTANITTRASVVTGGAQATGSSGSATPMLSADGRYVAFASGATNLVSGDSNNQYDVFMHDRLSGETTRISVSSTGAQATGGRSESPSISADGAFVAFHSTATNLVASDTNGASDVFVRDRTAGQTTRVSIDSAGAQAADASAARGGALSQDGRFVAYQSAAVNLVADDTNGQVDVFVHDRTTGKTTRQSVTALNAEATAGDSGNAVISGNGALVVFDSLATNLIPADTNSQLDVFRVSRR